MSKQSVKRKSDVIRNVGFERVEKAIVKTDKGTLGRVVSVDEDARVVFIQVLDKLTWIETGDKIAKGFDKVFVIGFLD